MKTKYPIEKFVDNLEDESSIPDKISKGIMRTVQDFEQRFEDLDETGASYKPRPQQWSKKEILGHLIDSAANNHQRFVRIQNSRQTDFQSYEQVEWVRVQRYNDRPWKDLLSLWKSYNLHLAHVISGIPAECLQITCVIGEDEPVTVGYIVVDYLGHMQHHLRQIEAR